MRHQDASLRRGPAPLLKAATVAVGVAAVLIGSGPAFAVAQEVPSPSDSARFAEADSIRASFDRPPQKPGTDWVDVAQFPLWLIGLPFRIIIVSLAEIAGEFTKAREPGFMTKGLDKLHGAGISPGFATEMGPNAGFALGFYMSTLDPVYAAAGWSFNGSQIYRGGVQLGEETNGFAAELAWKRYAQARFFGIGPNTDERFETRYRRDFWDSDTRFTISRAKFSGALGLGFESNEVSPASGGGRPPIDEFFNPDSLYGATQPTKYVHGEMAVTLDLRRDHEFQQRGWLLRAHWFPYFGVSGTDSDFQRLRGEAFAYLPANVRQNLAFRVRADLTVGEKGGGAPFFHLAELGGTESLRAFPDGRFRDNDALVFNLEWRYEIWRELQERSRVETFLFWDEGAVADKLSNVSLSDFHSSFGVGFRVVSGQGLSSVVYVAFGSEGIRPAVAATVPF